MKLGCEQAALGVEHLQIVRIAILVAHIGQLDAVLQCGDALVKNVAELGAVTYIGERILNVAKCVLNDELVIGE